MTRSFAGSPPFADGARIALGDAQLRRNLAGATTTIRAKRNRVAGELDTWEDLRRAGEAIKTSALDQLGELLVTFERRVTEAGGVVHWARDAAEANQIVVDLVAATGRDGVVKVKSMTTTETGLNQALEAAGVTVYETDLAELILQLGDDLPSHIVVPAVHRNRHEIRATFADHMGEWGLAAPADLSSDPADLAATARLFLRDRFLQAGVGVSGANFLVADTGSVVVVESEGNGRMCVTLPETLITVAGIDKVVPSWEDLDVFLQTLPRSATGERMNPYNSVWTGVTPGDGPGAVHVVLMDNGRSRALADTVGRQALRCIRCAACLNVCPVYERVGGRAYGSVYPGPIGAVLTPQLDHVASDDVATSLPYASTLCGACFDACPVRIDIPRLLVHLRGEVVDAQRGRLPGTQEQLAMAGAAWALGRPGRIDRLARLGTLAGRLLGARRLRLPGFAGAWTSTRATPLPSGPSFAEWWHGTHPGGDAPSGGAGQAQVPAQGAAWAPLPAQGAARAPWRRRHGRRRSPVPPAAGLSAPAGRATPGAGEARREVLRRIGEATGAGRPAVDIPRDYRRSPGARPDAVRLFAERVGDYRATIRRCDEAGIGATVAAVLAERGSASLVVPPGLDLAWTAGVTVPVTTDDPALSVADLDATASVLTACAVAIAETGTVVLHGGAGQGRRVLTLVPDHHVVVVREDQIVAGVPDAMSRICPTAPQTWVSGPSATSDIELDRVEGVHGPRLLDVVVVGR